MKWLHLSDIHYNPKMDGRSSEQLREKLLIFFKEQNIRVDEIFITGDFRHAYFQRECNISDVAKDSIEYIKRVADSVGISSMENIHIVPGNHDLTRSEEKKLNEILQKYDYSHGGFNEDDISCLQNRFDFFRCICQELYGNNSFYDDFSLNVHTYRLVDNHVILYMNTALACGSEDERGKLVIGNFYLYKILERIKNEYPEKQIIVLAHHAIECLSKKERETVEKLFNDYPISMYLCGDAHEPWCRRINQHIEVTVGCMVQEKNVEAVFCIGETETSSVISYHWDAKFSCWSDYSGFNKYMREQIGVHNCNLEKNISTRTSVHNLPKLPENYRLIESAKDEPFEILKKNRLLYISGISGIGKTSLSVKLADEIKSKASLNSIYFIDGSQISNSSGLNSVVLEPSGNKVNLLAMIKNNQSLFIIDDLQEDIENIMEEVWNEIRGINESSASYVIVTSQINSRFSMSKDMEYPLSFLTDEKQIMEILNWRIPKDKRCSIEMVRKIKTKTNGHPLLLNSLRSLVMYDDASWRDIIEEELSDFLYHEVEDGKIFISKILNRHKIFLEKELYSIKWLNGKNISELLLAKLISKEGIRKLASRSFIQKNNELIKVHDIIFRCINEENYDEQTIQKCNQQFNKRFYDYFRSERNGKSSAYFKALHLHEEKIVDLAKNKNIPGVEWYYYLQTFPNDDFKVLDSFSFTSTDCNQWILSNQADYIIGTILELIESESRKDKKSSSYRSNMDDRIQMLSNLIANVDTKKELYRDIAHHLGKLYRTIGNIDEAKKCFEVVLAIKPDSYETKLQLIRIQKNEKIISTEDIINEYSNLLDIYINGQDISMSIVLAAYGDLYSFDKGGVAKTRYFLDHFNHFSKAITSMAIEAFDQPYNILALTLKYYTYNHPDKLILLMDSIPIPSVEMINKKNYFDIAQMYKEAGKAIMWSEELSRTINAKNYFITAEDFYQLIDSEQLNHEYRCVQRAENLIVLEKYSEAVNVLNENKFVENAFWNYRLGQAMAYVSGLKDYKRESLQYLQAAIDLCKQEIHLASFYHAKANVLAELNDSRACDFYREALVRCKSDKYRRQIEKDMKMRYVSYNL